MSLFDIIKYKNTNLGDDQELSKLPSALLALYHKELFGLELNTEYENARILASWYISSTNCNDNSAADYNFAFNQALMKYES